MIPLSIWLLLIGYSIVWTGRQNLGLSYQPQPDGSIKPVGPDGKPARTWSLLDTVTCGQASGQPAGASAPAGPAGQIRQSPLPALLLPPGVPSGINIGQAAGTSAARSVYAGAPGWLRGLWQREVRGLESLFGVPNQILQGWKAVLSR